MKLSKNTTLGLIFLVLVAAAWAFQGPLQKWQTERKAPKNFMKLTGEPTKMEIESNGKKTVLTKEGDRWRASGEGKFYVNQGQMTSILDSLNSAKTAKLDLVSSNAGKQTDYQLSGNDAIKLTEKNDSGSVTFLIGKMTADYRGSYVSREKDPNTYKLSATNLRQYFSRDEWRDFSLFSLADKKPDFIRLQYPDSQLKLNLKGSDWSDGKSKYKKEEIERILTVLANISAAEIPKQDFKPAGLEKPNLIVQFKGDGFDQTLMLGKKNSKGLYYAKTGDSDNIYLINTSDFQTLTKRPQPAK